MDFRYHGIGLLISLRPLTDRARKFCDQRWPKGAPNTCRNTHGGQLLGSEDFEAALIAIADAGLEIEHQPQGHSYNEMEAANRRGAAHRKGVVSRTLNWFARAVEGKAFEGTIPVRSDDPEEQQLIDATRGAINDNLTRSRAAVERLAGVR